MTEPPQKVQRVDATDPPVARLLSVPFVHEYGGGESFYVRECYNKYYSIVEKLLVEENKQCVTVTGTPGIGKSVFYAYFCDRFRETHEDTCIIAACYKGKKVNKLAIFNGMNKPIRPTTSFEVNDVVHRALFEAIESNRKVLFLCDGPPETPPSDGQVVVFTSPNKDWLRLVRKDYCTYYMPLWTLEELQQAAVELRFSLRDEDIEARFEIFGGEARSCLSLKAQSNTKIRELVETIDEISSSEELRNLLSLKENTVTSHRLLHYVPDQDGFKDSTKLASPFVVQKLSERMLMLTNHNREDMRLLFSAIPQAGALFGYIFEVDAHEALRRKRSFSAFPATSGSSTITRRRK